MKLMTFFLLLLLNVSYVTAQKIVWLDAKLKPTSPSKALYYKVGDISDGLVTFFYKNRTVYRKVYMEKGVYHGEFMEYYKTGELKEVGVYEDGMREGNWREYYKTGKIKKKGKYQNGEKVGIWKEFFKNVY